MEKLAHASLEDFYLEMTKGLGKDMEKYLSERSSQRYWSF